MLSESIYLMLVDLPKIVGLTILLVDKEICQVLKISDYVYVLVLGRNRFEGPSSDFNDHAKAFWVT